MRLPVPPRTVHWLAIVLFSALVALLATPAHAQTDVPSNWPLIPSGLNAGDEFRLLLVTKRPMLATSNDISDYDAHVQSNISERGHVHIQAYAGNFKVLGSTATVNVRSHTGTTGTGGVPIYWIRGLRVADDYADFFDGSWANKQQGRYQDSSRISGSSRNRLLCTGTADDGTTTTLPLGGADPDRDGVSECTATTINTTTATLSGRAGDTSDSPRYLALSGVFRVAAAPVVLIESVEITSDSGGDKDYEAGDEIEITVTFSEAVAVTGTPRLKITLNGTRMAEYVGSGSTAADLVFSYTVTDRDYDLDGVSLPSNGLRLNGGTIKSQADGTDALLDLTAVPGGPAYTWFDPPAWEDISPHRVHNRPALTGVGVGPPLTGVSVGSNPAVGSSYSTGETILIDVHFDKPMRVITHEGVPTYEITFDGGRRREAHYTEVVWGNTVRFAYEVQSNDYDEDGLSASERAIHWNGGLITRNGVHDDITLALRAKDDHTALSGQSAHKVNALDTTMAPVIVDAGPFTVSENQTAVATLTATDGDTASADLVWTIEGGADESAFELTTAGVLTFAEAKDYEAPDDADADGAYEVDVMVSDGVNRLLATGAGAFLTVRLADVDETATGPKLTAEWVKFPPGHSGDGRKFTVRVKFSDPVTINVRRFRDYALSVTGGAVDKVWRVKGSGGEPRKDLWAIRVTPTSQQPLSLSLAAIQDCSEHGAICTADGTPLSNAASITVTGPNHDLTVADAEVEEGPGAALAFVVTLSGTAPYRVKVDYATSDGTATAGSDYTATSGTLIFERGETSKTISVPVLDDAHDDDSETLTLTLTNPKRGMIVDGEAVGTIRNSDHMPKAWIARFGRTVADQVLDAVEERLRSARTAGMSVSLGGETIGSTTAKAQAGGNSGAAPDGKAASLFDGTTADAEEVEQLKALSDWLSQDREEKDRSDGWSRTLTERELLMGSSFSLAAQTDNGGFAALWARMARTSFDGREGTLSLDGDVTTGLMGADYASGRWMTGLVASHSVGEGGYHRGETSGEIEATVTAVTPWARYAVTERLSVWGAAGYGGGELKLTPETGAALKTDLGMTLAAAGARNTLIGGDGPKLDAVTDARWVRTTTARVSSSAGNLASASAEVTRVRLGLEGSWPLALGDDALGKGATVTPRLAIGVRHDSGDAETGFGADIGGGVTLAAPAQGLTVSLEGRGVLTHEATGFRDRGLAGSLAWGPPPAGRGPKLTLRQTVGAGASGGKDALLSRTTLEGLAANDNGDGRRRLEARFGYGFGMFGGGFTGTPEIGLGLSEAGRDYSLGWRLTRAGSGAGSLEFSLEARRSESANDDVPAEHGIGFRATARW